MAFEASKGRHCATWGAGMLEALEPIGEDRTAEGIGQSRLSTVILGRRR